MSIAYAESADEIIGSPVEVKLPDAFQDIFEPHRNKAFYGGRGAAKSHSIAKALLLMGGMNKLRILCCREVQKSIKESVHLLLKEQIELLGLEDFYQVLSTEIRGENGTQFIFTGLADHTADSIKSYEAIDICWMEEAHVISDASLEILIPTIRKEGSEIWASWNPRNKSDPIDMRYRGEDPPADTLLVNVNWRDNPFFPAPLEAERVHYKRTHPDRYSHVYEGDYEPQAIGAIWSRQGIQDNRTTLERLAESGVELERIVVAVDPAVSDTDTSDEHGIVAVGLATNGKAYLLDDASRHGSPKQWAQAAWTLHDKWDADAIVIEKNQGGDMCKHTLTTSRTAGQHGRIVEVHATKGKHVRAEPISALCENGTIGYAGSFPEIENQLCLFTGAGYQGDKSPDRAEAFIWACTELFPKIVKKAEPKKPTRRKRPHNVSWMGS